MATGHDAKAWRQRPSFTWAFNVRVLQPLAKLGPLRALTASVRALSETLGFLADLRVAVLDGEMFFTEVAR